MNGPRLAKIHGSQRPLFAAENPSEEDPWKPFAVSNP